MKRAKEKVLIIKTGYSEVLDKEQDSKVVSLGDVIRTTPLLYKYKEDNVTWATSEEAFPLLIHNPYIDRLLVFDFINANQLAVEKFDTLINLEKVPGICAFTDKHIDAWKRFGFRYDSEKRMAEAYDRAYEVLAVSFNPAYKKGNKRTFQELLFEMVGGKWNGEEYILGYQPETEEVYDVGLNTRVGKKWPTKAWSMGNWDKLEAMLEKQGLKVSRQEKQHPKILENLFAYMDWINSCKLLVTNDSLGLHLAFALKKKVLGLFGPTSANELYFYKRGKAMSPEFSDNSNAPNCIPCFKQECSKYKNSCVDLIFPEKVLEEIKSYLL